MKTYTYETANKFGAPEVEFKAQYNNHKKSFTMLAQTASPLHMRKQLLIAEVDPKMLLNKRSEYIGMCRHRINCTLRRLR